MQSDAARQGLGRHVADGCEKCGLGLPSSYSPKRYRVRGIFPTDLEHNSIQSTRVRLGAKMSAYLLLDYLLPAT